VSSEGPLSAEVEEPIRERVAAVRERIAQAARRADRNPAEVTLVGVSKRQPPERVAAAIRAGIRELGENYVQETRDKQPRVEALIGDSPRPRWRMIGSLQRNKARVAVGLFDAIETLDRISLANELEKRRAEGEPLSAFVQVNISDEPQKSGLPCSEVAGLLEACAGLERVQIEGLMAVPAASADPEQSRAAFAALRGLRDELRGRPGGEHLAELSMGMSSDFEVAIEEGATFVRIGTAIFGPRPGA